LSHFWTKAGTVKERRKMALKIYLQSKK
jgi:hypothetical protein